MKSLISPTEDFIRLARTSLTSDVAQGASVALAVVGNQGFAQNNYVCIGVEGSDNCEIAQLNTVVTEGTALQVATLVFSHKQDEPVVVFRYNQRKLYGSLTLNGSFSELVASGSPKNIAVSDPQGTLFEYSGNEGYIYFKSTYFNSSTNEETDVAEAVAILADETVRYCSLYSIARQAGMQDNPFISNGILEQYRAQAENEVNSYMYNRYVLPLTNQTTNLPEIPAIVERCTILLAAGYMDYREYGKDGEGVKWLGEARGILKAIQNGVQRLLGSDMIEFQQKELTQGIQSFPGSVDNVNGPTQKFTMDQQF